MKNAIIKQPEYYNITTLFQGRAYRVAFHRGGRPMIVCRRTKHGETALVIDGPTARKVIAEAARHQLTSQPA